MPMDIDFDVVFHNFYQLGFSFLLALPIALNREHRSNGAGLRTFPLVAIASSAFMLVGMSVYEGSEAEARVMYGIITGMGFIGGGAIIKTSDRTVGTATAAGIWTTGAIGVSVAYSRYEIALVLSFISFMIFQFSDPLKNRKKTGD